MRHRIGIGYDLHRLVEGRKLFIGGIEIPYEKGLLAHSDGDVLLHAVCDALLGAMSLGDIGELFPDTDPKYKDISSIELLRNVVKLIKKNGCIIGNADAVIIAQEPKLGDYKKKIQQNIARELGVTTEDVCIKAKTNEGIGEIGNKGAIASYVVVMVKKEG